MVTIDNLKITKFFDVKTPVGVNQRNESLDNYSIGVDLYFPRLSDDFIREFIKANEKLHGEINVVENCIDDIWFYAENKTVILVIMNTKVKPMFVITQQVTIPTGIGMLLPKNVWCEVRSKSSNFNMEYTEVHGTVDMNYTYSCGVQIIPFKDAKLTFEQDQKFTQLVFHEAVPVMNIEEVLLDDWNNLDEVKFKRGMRTGGFGSSGKFDK